MGLIIVLVLAIAVVSGVMFLSGRVARLGTTARMHVDDLAVGHAPTICAVTGVPTTHRVEVSSSESGFQGWWLLLLFFGPVGIVAIIVLAALARRPGRVSGILPVSPEALARYDAMVRLSRRAMGTAIGLLVLGTLVVTTVGRAVGTDGRVVAVVAVAIAIAALVGLAASIVAPFRWLDLRLDGSGRWVTVTRVHPDFASALYAQNAQAHART